MRELKILRNLLDYDPETGVFSWLDVSGKRRDLISQSAGTRHSKGYIQIRLNKRSYFAHRLAWIFSYGEWPSDQIDHINGIKDDNRIVNLRLSNNSQNHANTARQRNNTSGFKGVVWLRRTNKWRAQMQFYGRTLYFGQFDNREEAAAAYAIAAREHFGEFAMPA